MLSIFGALAIAYALASLGRTGAGRNPRLYRARVRADGGVLVTWAFWCSNIAAQAALAIATASALSRLFPALGSVAGIVAVGIGSVVALTLVNLRGVRTAGDCRCSPWQSRSCRCLRW